MSPISSDRRGSRRDRLSTRVTAVSAGGSGYFNGQGRRGRRLTPAVSGVSASAMCSFRLGYGKTGRCRRRPGAATTDSSAEAS